MCTPHPAAVERGTGPPIRVLLPLVLLAIAAAAVPGSAAGAYRVVLVVPVNTTVLDSPSISQPQIPLTKVECGGVVAVVYGPGYGRPTFIVVYAEEGVDWRSRLPDCIPSLESCLATVGAYKAIRVFEELASTAHGATVHSMNGAQLCLVSRPPLVLEALLFFLGAVLLALRLYRMRRRSND